MLQRGEKSLCKENIVWIDIFGWNFRDFASLYIYTHVSLIEGATEILITHISSYRSAEGARKSWFHMKNRFLAGWTWSNLDENLWIFHFSLASYAHHSSWECNTFWFEAFFIQKTTMSFWNLDRKNQIIEEFDRKLEVLCDSYAIFEKFLVEE